MLCFSLLWRYLGNAVDDELAGLCDLIQVFTQSETETAHPQIEEKSCRKYQSCYDVQPFPTERSGMCMGSNDRVAIEVGKDTPVSGVRQVLYDFL